MKKLLVFVLSYLSFCLLAQAQPAWSRGEQRLQLSFQEGMSRAYAALQGEGYVNMGAQANMTYGYKGDITAVITINDAASGGFWINIFVSSLTNNSGVPGGERVRLQTRMGQAASTPTTSVSPTTPVSPTTSVPAGANPIDWEMSAYSYGLRGKNYQRFSFTCPAGNPSSRVWGTDIYTDDSSICTAAVHAGFITSAGGTVTIEIRPGLSAYTGKPQNGIASKDYTYLAGSIMFVR